MPGNYYLDDPTQICDAALDPSIPAEVVLAAARARSHTGRLLERVQQLIYERPPLSWGEAIGMALEFIPK